jgi:hypothetical protein
MLNESFPEFLKENKNLTGVYVGNLNYSLKAITDEDEGDE